MTAEEKEEFESRKNVYSITGFNLTLCNFPL